jgi:hypothetical protein
MGGSNYRTGRYLTEKALSLPGNIAYNGLILFADETALQAAKWST